MGTEQEIKVHGSRKGINYAEPSRQLAELQFDVKDENKPVKVSEKCLETSLMITRAS